MKCPDCKIDLIKQDAGYGPGHGKDAIKLRVYYCRSCEKPFAKNLETGEAVRRPIVGEIPNNLERF